MGVVISTFRRAYIDRERGAVLVETAANVSYLLPGVYDPEKMMAKVIERGSVDLKNWKLLPKVS